MAGFIRRFLTNVCICIFATDSRQRRVYAAYIKNSKIIRSVQEDFDLVDGHMDLRFSEFVNKLTHSAHSFYVIDIIGSPSQWAIPANDIPGYNKFSMNVEGSDIVKMPGNWTIFAPKSEIKEINTILSGIAPDLIYSPFALLYDKIRLNFLEDKLTLYVYNFESFCAIMIFRGLDMKFGLFASTEAQIDTLDIDSAYQLDTVDISDIDDFIIKEEELRLENFKDIESLDEIGKQSGDSFEDIAEVDEEENESGNEEEEKDIEWSVAQSGKFSVLIKNIKHALKDFYSNDLFESDFIDDVSIFDASGYIDSQFAKELSDEIFVDVKFQATDLRQDMIQIAKRELKL